MDAKQPTYQPIVLEHTENLLKGLEEAEFFVDYEIGDLTFARNYLNDLFTEKFIKGELDIEEDSRPLFDEPEFEKMLREIAAGSVLYDLKKMGYIDSYEDNTTEEMFFLTKKGKKYLDTEE
jgi:hypothetical protein